MEKKLGVVIFSSDYYQDEGLAALRWASVLSLSKVHILLVQHEPNDQQIDKTQKFTKDGLFEAVRREGENNRNNSDLPNYRDWLEGFEGCINKLDPEKELPLYKGPNIQEILEEAIDDFNLHTLVLGMPAAGSTPPSNIDANSGRSTDTSNIDLIMQLNSKCSVVLATTAVTDVSPTVIIPIDEIINGDTRP